MNGNKCWPPWDTCIVCFSSALSSRYVVAAVLSGTACIDLPLPDGCWKCLARITGKLWCGLKKPNLPHSLERC